MRRIPSERGPSGDPGFGPPVYEEPQYDAGGEGWPDARWVGEARREGRPRSAIHDPWREPRQVQMPSTLPTGPTLFVAIAAIVLAFLLGRATGGGGDEVSARNVSTVSSSTTTTRAPIVHTVQENETLSTIATHYGLSVDELAAANGITDVNTLREGQQIVVPVAAPPTVATTTATKNKN